MSTDQKIVERVEDALSKSPYCRRCGQPTAIAERDCALWLECSSNARPRSRLQSLLRLDLASSHTRHPIVELCMAA